MSSNPKQIIKFLFPVLIVLFLFFNLKNSGIFNTFQKAFEDPVVESTTEKTNIESNIEKWKKNIEVRKAKEKLTDHDKWYIAHMEKMIKNQGKLNESQKNRKNQFQKTGVINARKMTLFFGSFLLTMVVFMGIVVFAPDKRLSSEEKLWLQNGLESVPNLSLSNQRLPQASGESGIVTNIITYRLRSTSSNTFEVKRSVMLTSSVLLFGITGVSVLLGEIYGVYASGKPFSDFFSGFLMMPITFIGVSLWVHFSLSKKIKVDGMQRRLQITSSENSLQQIPFASINAVQVDSFIQPTQRGRAYQKYQIQLNLNEGGTIAIFNHTGKDQIIVDAIRLALFLKKPLVV